MHARTRRPRQNKTARKKATLKCSVSRKHARLDVPDQVYPRKRKQLLRHRAVPRHTEKRRAKVRDAACHCTAAHANTKKHTTHGSGGAWGTCWNGSAVIPSQRETASNSAPAHSDAWTTYTGRPFLHWCCRGGRRELPDVAPFASRRIVEEKPIYPGLLPFRGRVKSAAQRCVLQSLCPLSIPHSFAAILSAHIAADLPAPEFSLRNHPARLWENH
jgi:hypothetical protein